jgi:hypothetical protein
MRNRLLVALGLCALFGTTAVAAQGTKWHPGHYVMFDGSAKANLDAHLSYIAELRNETAVEGIMVRFWWHDLEPRLGEYDFALIDAYLTALGNLSPKKRLVVRIMDRKFGTASPRDIVPDYLRENSAYNGGVVSSGDGFVARLWEDPVMGRLVKLYQAIGRRYDSNPLFEGAFTEETTLSFAASKVPSGYSHERLAEQYVRFVKAVKPTMPKSNLFLNANWIGSDTIMSDLIQQVRNASAGAGGSNVIPGSPTLGQRALSGVFGADYRLELPIANGVETGELGGALGDFTPKQIAAYAYDVLRAHYLFWVRNTWNGSPQQRWDTGILPFLRTHPPIRTRCPNVYGICVSGDEPAAAGSANEQAGSADADRESSASDDAPADPAPPATANPAPPAATPTPPPAPGAAPSSPAEEPVTAASPPATALPNLETGGGGSLGWLEVLLIGLLALGARRELTRLPPPSG